MKKLTKQKNGVAVAKKSAPPHKSAPRIGAATVKLTATEYCLFHYPTLYTADTPRLSSDADNKLWKVPVVLSTPSHGVLGQVGEVRIDAKSGKVIAATDRAQVVAAGEPSLKGLRNASAAGPARE